MPAGMLVLIYTSYCLPSKQNVIFQLKLHQKSVLGGVLATCSSSPIRLIISWLFVAQETVERKRMRTENISACPSDFMICIVSTTTQLHKTLARHFS